MQNSKKPKQDSNEKGLSFRCYGAGNELGVKENVHG
jgi:hypothetical protein